MHFSTTCMHYARVHTYTEHIMDELRKKAIDRLMKRRQMLQEEYDHLVSEPASYGITGSVNATNRGLKEIRDEISVIDDKISSLIESGNVAGMHVKYPDYRHSPFGGLQ